jgi:hypothetical protein
MKFVKYHTYLPNLSIMITSNNTHCQSTPKYIKTYSMPYLCLSNIKPPPMSFSGEVDTGRGNPHKPKKMRFFGPDQKLLPAPPNFKKTIALTFLKADYPQNPY